MSSLGWRTSRARNNDALSIAGAARGPAEPNADDPLSRSRPRENEVNRCPGCGRSHWYVGRLLAECGFCGTALPLADSGTSGVGLVRRGQPYREDFANAA